MSIEKQIKMMAAIGILAGMNVAGVDDGYRPPRNTTESEPHKLLREDRKARRKRERAAKKKNRK